MTAKSMIAGVFKGFGLCGPSGVGIDTSSSPRKGSSIPPAVKQRPVDASARGEGIKVHHLRAAARARIVDAFADCGPSPPNVSSAYGDAPRSQAPSRMGS
jgi:hypothetical protein